MWPALLGFGANLLLGSIARGQQRRAQKEQIRIARKQAEWKANLDERRAGADYQRVLGLRDKDLQSALTLRDKDFQTTAGLKDIDFRNTWQLNQQQNDFTRQLEDLRQSATTNRLMEQLKNQRNMQQAGFDQQNIFRAQSAALALRGLK